MAISRAERLRRKRVSMTNSPLQEAKKPADNAVNESIKETPVETKTDSVEGKLPEETKVEAVTPKTDKSEKTEISDKASSHAEKDVTSESSATNKVENTEPEVTKEEVIKESSSEEKAEDAVQPSDNDEKPKKRRRGRPKGSKNKATIEAEKKAEKKASKEAAKSDSTSKRSRSPSTKPKAEETSESKSSSDDGEPSRVAVKPKRSRKTRRNFASQPSIQNDDDFFSQQDDNVADHEEIITHAKGEEYSEDETSSNSESVRDNTSESHASEQKETVERPKSLSPARGLRRHGRNRFQNVATKQKAQQERADNEYRKDALDSDLYPTDRQPVSGLFDYSTEQDSYIVIKPFSTIPFVNGKVPEKAHQETSNIRFTDHDRVMAEESGLSWD